MAIWMLDAAPSPWELGWEFLVAVGTILLALATFRLAQRTATEVEHTARLAAASLEQVAATQDQARASHEALDAAREQSAIAQLTLNAQIRPVLIDVLAPMSAPTEEAHYAGTEPRPTRHGVVVAEARSDEALVSLPLRNAGAGLAMIQGVELRLGLEIFSVPVTIRPANIPRGEHGRVGFRATPRNAAFAPLGETIHRRQSFSIEVRYTDLSGRQPSLTRFDVYCSIDDPPTWYVRQVHQRGPGEDAPTAGSAPIA
jgi:hypothetical protein